MNRISEATVTNVPSSGKLLVINRTQNEREIKPDLQRERPAVARVVNHGFRGGYDDLESNSQASTVSKFESFLSSEPKKRITADNPSLSRLKEKIERQKASRAIVPNIETRNLGTKTLIRKVASATGPSTYLGFNTGVEKQIPVI
jgi:hypothetical protein